MPLNYPPPDQNPLCQCKANPMAAFFCQNGHMLECHYPYDCSTAACSHLLKYEFSPEEVEELTDQARTAIKNGRRKPYTVDEFDNVWIEQEPDKEQPS